ncbi:MAG: family 10 glycosylhydrolase [Planctomycetes bacterium]|nr:family 10 glycosylhydrolase [Planctomycetota bacterium]
MGREGIGWSLLGSMVLAVLATVGHLRRERHGPPPEVRAVWVTRFDYRSAGDVAAIFAGAASLGFNRVLFQVRGEADALYASRLEPWSERLGGGDPGWDPLAEAVAAARRRGVALEAWINLMPLWRGTTPPRDPAHPYRLHPEWVVVGRDGRPQALNAHYTSANPAREDVRAHLAAVAAEIASLYDVDAVHLDYVRYVTDLADGQDFGHDPVSLAAFGGDPAAEPEAWGRFKRDQVTEAVRAIRRRVRDARPGCALTAAVFPTEASRARVCQDAGRWAREGLVDALYPMLYDRDDAQFAERAAQALRLGPVPVYPGIGAFQHPEAEQTVRQVEIARAAGARGFALFCYASFFPSRDAEEIPEHDDALRERRRGAVAEALSLPDRRD